jgi:hypothetical protein
MEHLMQEPTRRRDAGILQVTERDILVLTWIAEQFCISYDHVQRLLALLSPATTKHPDRVAPSTAQNAIERWLQLGYIDVPHKIIREHATYIWLSRKGLKELGLPYGYYQPKPSSIRHLYAVNAIRLHLQRFQIAAEWRARRHIRLHTERRPVPDAEILLDDCPIIALQVLEQPRLTTMTLQDELTTMQALTRTYSRLWYFVHAQVREPLQKAVQASEDASDIPHLPEDQLPNCVVWYSLDAKEILPKQEK